MDARAWLKCGCKIFSSCYYSHLGMERSNSFYRSVISFPKMEKRDEVIQCLRSCLISTKGTLELQQLRSDYKMVMGHDIPFRQLGHSSVEDFIRSIPSLQMDKANNGHYYVDATPDEKSSHIVDLIAKQKTARKRVRFSQKPVTKNVYPKNSLKWKPTNYGNKKNYQMSSLPAAVSHKQFITTPKKNVPPYRRESPPKKDLPPYRQELPPRYQKMENAQKTPRTCNNISEITSADFNGPTRPKLFQRKSSDVDSNSSSGSENNRKTGTSQKPQAGYMRTLSQRRENNHTQSFQSTGDALVDLYSFVSIKSLKMPEFIIVEITPKGYKHPIFNCKLTVGEESFTTYPKEFTDEISAKQHVAKTCLEKLIPIFDKKNQQLVSTAEDVLQRIPPIVEKHVCGIWNKQLQEDYVYMFHEQLPSDWIKIVDRCPHISVEQYMENKFVLQYRQPGQCFQKGKNPNAPLTFEVSVPSNTVKFSENGTLHAEITCVVSAKEIWCRQLDTSEAASFVDMSLSLDNSYSSPYRTNPDGLRATTIIVGGYYIACFDNSFIRVRVLEVRENDVHCFLVDFGDDCILSKNNIYNMLREFAREQAQAFICRLAGLEDLYEVSAQSEHLQALVGKEVQLETAEDNCEYDPSDPVVSVVMYDIETKECINKEMISILTIESASPSLAEGATYKVLVKHLIEQQGDIFVQVPSPGLDKLESLIADLRKSINENFPQVRKVTKDNISKDKLYFAKYKEDDEWYRVRVHDMDPVKTYAQLVYVDYGNETIVPLAQEQLIPLDEISDVINQFPFQAIRVRMDLEKTPPDFVNIFNKLVNDEQPILMKIISNTIIDGEKVALVEFFKRSEPDGFLFSINKTIALPCELRISTDGDGNNNRPSEKIQKLMSLNQFDDGSKKVPSSGSLPAPIIEDIGQYFDVVVPHAVSPYNFFVQPYKQNKELIELQKKLQEKYSKLNKLSPLTIEDILPGKIYASKHSDEKWYRTSVIKVIGPASISVCYCDYGYYSNVAVQQLLPLDPEFTQLPYQAIKAKLYGIKPCRDKWTVEDCKYFQQLVLRKSLVSVIVNVDKDELYKSDRVLELNLFDTSTEKDINIGDLLVDSHKAVKA